jgi:Protein of unknown function (DUF3433)
VEPFLVVVSRYLCFLQPFEDLRKGSAKASQALLQRYTSQPPQLAVIPAAKNGHLRLASLSLAAILSNILTIALSGIFVIRETIIPTDVGASQVYSPALNRSIIDGSESFEKVGSNLLRTNGEVFQVLLSNITAGTPLPPWTTQERYYLPVNLTLAPDESPKYRLTTLGFQGSTSCNVLTEFPSDFMYELSLNSDATQIRFLTTQTMPNGTKGQCFAPMGMADETVTFFDGDHPTTQVLVEGYPAGLKAVESFMIPIGGFSLAYDHKFVCGDHFLGFWVRANISLGEPLSIVNGPAQTENIGFVTTGRTANTTSVSLEKLVLACKPMTYAASYNLTVDRDGQVLRAEEIPNTSFTMNETISDGAFDQVRGALANLTDFLVWHNDSRARDWMSFFISKIAESDSLLNPKAPLPDGIELGHRVSDVVGRLFAVTLAVNKDAFIELQQPVLVAGRKLSVVNRVFLAGDMYKIALAILCIDILVVLNIYLRMRKPFLPRMPTSIASNVAFFAASHFAQELAEEAETCTRPEEVVSRLKKADMRFGFGKFVGTDGGIHVGIEREPFVQALGSSRGIRSRSRWKFWQP